MLPDFAADQGGSACAAVGAQVEAWSGGVPEDAPRRVAGQLDPGVAMGLAPFVRGRQEQGVCDAFTAMDASALLRSLESDRSRSPAQVLRLVLRMIDELCTRLTVSVTGVGN